MDPVQQQQQAMHMMAMMLPMIFLFWIVGAAIVIVPFWQIFKKAGMAPGLSFLIVIPLVNLVMLYVLAFSEWKVVPVSMMQYPPQYPPATYPPASYTAPIDPPAAPPTDV
jgi:hypothetical protein